MRHRGRYDMWWLSARKGSRSFTTARQWTVCDNSLGCFETWFDTRFVRPKFGTLMDAGKAEVLAFTAWPSILRLRWGLPDRAPPRMSGGCK